MEENSSQLLRSVKWLIKNTNSVNRALKDKFFFQLQDPPLFWRRSVHLQISSSPVLSTFLCWISTHLHNLKFQYSIHIAITLSIWVPIILSLPFPASVFSLTYHPLALTSFPNRYRSYGNHDLNHQRYSPRNTVSLGFCESTFSWFCSLVSPVLEHFSTITPRGESSLGFQLCTLLPSPYVSVCFCCCNKMITNLRHRFIVL